MKFKEAYRLMREDKKVKLPSWSGFWCWDKNKESIIMHTKEGEVLDIRDTKNVGYTLTNIFSDEWEEATPINTPLIGGSLAMSFETALMLMKCKKRPMRRNTWEDGTYIITWDSAEGPRLKRLRINHVALKYIHQHKKICSQMIGHILYTRRTKQ